MLKQTPLGLSDEVRQIGEDKEVQCKLCNLIRRFADSRPETTLNELIDFDLLDKEGLCEEHILRLSMRYETAIKDCELDQNQITVKMVNEILAELLPLAA
jgi:hypothetical protein